MNKKIDISTLDLSQGLGRIPPQSVDLEEALLGALLVDNSVLNEVISIMKPEYFYKDIHRKICQAVVDLYNNSKPIDILTVTEHLRKINLLEDVGGPLFITQLSSKASTAIHAEYYAQIIMQKWLGREVIRISTTMSREAYSDEKDIDDVISTGLSEYSNILGSISTGQLVHISEPSAENIDVMRKVMAGETDLQGIPTLFKELDELCNGLQKSDLVIIASRPSMGKTALLVAMANNIAVVQGKPVVIFSLEMSKRQIDLRFKVFNAEINSQKIFRGKMDLIDFEKILSVSKKINDSPIYIDDTAWLNIVELRSKVQKLMLDQEVEVIFVDYIQLMAPIHRSGRSRENEVAEISRGLKLIAREFNIPVIALSQLSRAAELTQDQRPKLAHLRESGSQEADADQVWFVYRAYKAGIKEIDGQSTYGKAEIIVAKHRNGPLGTANLGFKDSWIKFMNMEEMGDTQLEIPEEDIFRESDDNPFKKEVPF